MLRPKDKYLFCIENKPLSKGELFSILGNDERGYQYLLEFGYLSKNSDIFSFQFVGVIVINNNILCVLPKYYSSTDLADRDLTTDIIQIIKVLKKAGATEPFIPDFSNISILEKKSLSEIIFADKLLKDYLEHGIYIKSKELFEINSDGEVNWHKTIESIDPIFSHKTPIYVDCYNLTVVNYEYHIITELHKFIIKQSFYNYGELLDYKFAFHEDSVNNLADLGSIPYLIGVLKKELNDIYIDRDLYLIENLLYFLQKKENNSSGSFTLYGTQYFHIIWEKACGVFFSNKIDLFKKHIPTPSWSDNYGNEVSKDSLIPDIITYSSDNQLFFVLDAKYYNLQYTADPFNVSGNPGVSDVSKQFLYHKIFEETRFSEKFNCFLFPSLQTEAFYIVGSVTFSLFNNLKIYNLRLSSNMIYQSYIENDQQGDEMLTKLKLLICCLA